MSLHRVKINQPHTLGMPKQVGGLEVPVTDTCLHQLIKHGKQGISHRWFGQMLSILAQRAVCLLLMDPPRVRIRHDAPARMGAAADYLVERLECSPQQASLAESKMLPNLAASLDSATAVGNTLRSG